MKEVIVQVPEVISGTLSENSVKSPGNYRITLSDTGEKPEPRKYQMTSSYLYTVCTWSDKPFRGSMYRVYPLRNEFRCGSIDLHSKLQWKNFPVHVLHTAIIEALKDWEHAGVILEYDYVGNVTRVWTKFSKDAPSFGSSAKMKLWFKRDTTYHFDVSVSEKGVWGLKRVRKSGTCWLLYCYHWHGSFLTHAAMHNSIYTAYKQVKKLEKRWRDDNAT